MINRKAFGHNEIVNCVGARIQSLSRKHRCRGRQSRFRILFAAWSTLLSQNEIAARLNHECWRCQRLTDSIMFQVNGKWMAFQTVIHFNTLSFCLFPWSVSVSLTLSLSFFFVLYLFIFPISIWQFSVLLRKVDRYIWFVTGISNSARFHIEKRT